MYINQILYNQNNSKNLQTFKSNLPFHPNKSISKGYARNEFLRTFAENWISKRNEKIKSLTPAQKSKQKNLRRYLNATGMVYIQLMPL